jgi:hypothetical protein
MTTRQVETATVIGTITLTGNATVTVTAYGMGNSPKAISVAVSDTDTASIVGGLIRTALAFDSDVAAMFLVSGSGANVVLTKHVATANDSTLNIAIANGTCTGLTAAPTSTNTTAGDGLNNGYCTLAEMKSKYLLDLSVATYDAMIEKTINAVSRKIDNHCGRHFYQVTETRYFTPERGRSGIISIDDVYTTSGFLLYTDDGQDGTYENTWATTDYSLLPTNATTKSLPYTSIEVKTLGAYRFPYGRASVKVTASFGWSAIPDPVQVACLMHSNRIVKRFLTPLGESATSALGTMKLSIPSFDPDILNLLEDYVRLEE